MNLRVFSPKRILIWIALLLLIGTLAVVFRMPRKMPPLYRPTPLPHVLRKMYTDKEIMEHFVPDGCPIPPWLRDLNVEPVRLWAHMGNGRPGVQRVEGCSTPCVIDSPSMNEMGTAASTADAHMYSVFDVSSDFPPHFLNFTSPFCPLRRIVFWGMESEEYYPMVRESRKHGFDISMDYRLSSDVPIPYLNNGQYSLHNNYTPFENKKKDVLASAFISNCSPRNDRLRWQRELMKLIRVDSYGACEKNIDETIYPEGRHVFKKEKLKEYLFTFAFENSDADDYVTEKIYQAFEAGTVPVYMGTDTIDKFIPSDHSTIKVSDYKSPKELADYLIYLSEHKDEYEAYLAWKSEPMPAHLREISDNSSVDNKCRLCGVVAGHDVGWGVSRW
ncbi:hypothetical protein BC938DRAFT_483152 [Jimgerdemannia flammicorona]|uniref:Fucosyltransferase n=1 Tax=Jimgerdemannia flammicorona TaxID=994334 RepID=A0A433QCG8_9FUNG|nr:hypothetical protein BC938DRAFT_483152 [Jimgerdemannia flammicorona]